MEPEDLKSVWNEYDRKLTASMRLNTALLQRANLGLVETSLHGMSRELVVELILNAGAILLLGSFAAYHIAQARFAIPAIVLDVYAIAVLVGNIAQLAQIHSIDYDEPVVAIQQRLQRLKIQRILTVKWLLLSAPLMWVPLLIVGLRALGVDAYAAFGARYLIVNVLFGVAVIPLGVSVAAVRSAA